MKAIHAPASEATVRRYPAAVPASAVFLIIVGLCLILAGCQTDEIVTPPADDTDGPVCTDRAAAEIVLPPVDAAPGYPPRFRFEWKQHGDEPIKYARHLLVKIAAAQDGIAMLNDDPDQFEQAWTDWEPWDPAGGSVIVGEDERLEDHAVYLFAVQAMDGCGRVIEDFSADINARQFIVHTVYPVLTVAEPLLGGYTFYGTNQHPPAVQVPPRATYRFEWSAEQTYPWFGPIEYRFGWDLQDLGTPGDWYYDWNPSAVWFGPRTFYSGVHVFYVEARDEAGSITRARIEIEVIPFPMDRPVLWIDDWLLPEQPDPYRIYPTEEQHDTFWTGLCSLVSGFDSQRDVLEAALQNYLPIQLSALSRYRSVIWTYGCVYTSWQPTIRFVPETCLGCPWPRTNSLRLYYAAGGSALTCGYGSRDAGLAATFEESPLFPADVVRDISPYKEDGGLFTMAHDDYYVTVIDKVIGEFRTGMPEGIYRSLDRDAMRRADLAGFSYYLPPTLDLRDEITQPGMFWYPPDRGFHFVEVYDPSYWMDYRMLESHPCFEPIYLMRARSTLSPLDHAAVAIWTLDGECEDSWLYPYRPRSAHFGLPLWYIEPEQSEAIVRYLFEGWGVI